MTCNLHTSHANNTSTRELPPCDRVQDAQHVDDHGATASAPYAMHRQQGSPTCNPGPPRASVQPSRHAGHNPSPWHAPNRAMRPKQSYQPQLPMQHESTATRVHLPQQQSQQHLQRQPVPYPGAYSVHLAQRWPDQVRVQSVARTLTIAPATAPTSGSTTVNSSAITNWHDQS